MAAPEEPELSQAQTEKLLQFQVDSANRALDTTLLGTCASYVPPSDNATPLTREDVCVLALFCTVNFDNVPPAPFASPSIRATVGEAS